MSCSITLCLILESGSFTGPRDLQLLARLADQQVPATAPSLPPITPPPAIPALCWGCDVHSHAQLLHGCWGFSLRSSCLGSRCLPTEPPPNAKYGLHCGSAHSSHFPSTRSWHLFSYDEPGNDMAGRRQDSAVHMQSHSKCSAHAIMSMCRSAPVSGRHHTLLK